MNDDKLADAITKAMRWHGVQIVVDGRDVCACGADTGPHEGSDWDELERHNVHLAAVLAATARAFIGHEIHRRGAWIADAIEDDPGEAYRADGFEECEQIARGDTK